MSLLWWMALAGAAEMTCDMRGLSVRIEYDEAGEVTVFDGEEVLAKAQADPIVVTETKASCVGDRFRLIRGGNVAQDGDHATLSVGTMEMDFGPLLDTLPEERFDPHKAGVRKARRSAAKGDFVGMDQHLQQVQPITVEERDALVEVLLQEGSRTAVGRAWAFLSGGDSPHRREAGLTLLKMHAEEGELDNVKALAAKLPDEPEACEWTGRVDWIRGKKGKAKKQWATCSELSEEALGWCGDCQG